MSLASTVEHGTLRSIIRDGLMHARSRTLALVDCVREDDQRAQHSPLMSPMVWDLAHIGNYEELWLLRAIDGRAAIDPALDDLYNAFEHPRWKRPSLPILSPADARSYVQQVRTAALDLLDRVRFDDDALLRDGFVYGMVIQHEHQHDETLLATHQLMLEHALRPPGSSLERDGTRVTIESDEVLVPGGRFAMGTSVDPWAYDNERPAHGVDVAPFHMDTTPVTNAAFTRFIDDGAYDEPAHWTAEGWQWRVDEAAEHPQFWRRNGEGWELLRFGRWVPVDPDEPVQHVSWHEASAYASWIGRRLPTETEWEFAATFHPDEGKRRYPWGDQAPGPEHANLGQRHDGPAPVGTYPAGTSPWGCHQMIGDVWEWTSSTFDGYPGFRSFPYREYSEVFFGDEYRVLRGGSWATDPVAIRGTFRNWDFPIRRQIFAGFRCARDA